MEEIWTGVADGFSPLVGYPKWKVEMQDSSKFPSVKIPRISNQ